MAFFAFWKVFLDSNLEYLMSKNDDEWYSLDNFQFEHLIIYKSGGQDAWKRFQEILENGGKPIAFYSSFHGFSVMDEKTNAPIETKRLTSMKLIAKPHQGLIETQLCL